MEKRKLGYTDLQLTTIGLGTWAMGGDGWAFAWGKQDDDASVAAIHRALDSGINWIDTAAVYGLGHSEEIVGKAIADRREEVLVATKCARVWDEQTREIGKSLKAESIRREIEGSLRRLNIEVIDLYQIHWPEPDEDVEEGWTTIAELVSEGKIRYAGVSNFSVSQLQRAQAIHPVASLQPPYSMLRREPENETLAFCAANEIGVVAYSPMQAGLLTGKFTRERAESLGENDWRSRAPWFQEPQLSVNLDVVEKLRVIADRKEITLSQLSLAWVLRRPELTAAIVGARRPDQIEETVQAGSIRLSTAEIAEVEALLEERERQLSDD
jgi:aryl-alcohol dehydrogenase-like predicted oxidoreductase